MVYTPGALRWTTSLAGGGTRKFVFSSADRSRKPNPRSYSSSCEIKATSGRLWVLSKDVSKLSTWAVPKAAPSDRHDLPGLPTAASRPCGALLAIRVSASLATRSRRPSRTPSTGGPVQPKECTRAVRRREQRVAIARAMSEYRPSCCADETHNNLDPENVAGHHCIFSTESIARARPSSWLPTTRTS